jgi:hypothetical protein
VEGRQRGEQGEAITSTFTLRMCLGSLAVIVQISRLPLGAADHWIESVTTAKPLPAIASVVQYCFACSMPGIHVRPHSYRHTVNKTIQCRFANRGMPSSARGAAHHHYLPNTVHRRRILRHHSGGLSQIFRGAPAPLSGFCTHRPAELGMYLAGGADRFLQSHQKLKTPTVVGIY